MDRRQQNGVGGARQRGSYIAGVGKGFAITVPADTATRQISVYLGGYASTGKLVAHLSDGSAADFTDSSYSSATAIYQANYTLSYHAASAGQTLTLTWTMISGAGNGNVVIDGAALAGGTATTIPTTPTGLKASQGTSATAVTLSWNAVGNATSYKVYRSTAAGTQGAVLGTSAANSYSDATVVAGTTYYYSVAATNAAGLECRQRPGHRLHDGYEDRRSQRHETRYADECRSDDGGNDRLGRTGRNSTRRSLAVRGSATTPWWGPAR